VPSGLGTSVVSGLSETVGTGAGEGSRTGGAACGGSDVVGAGAVTGWGVGLITAGVVCGTGGVAGTGATEIFGPGFVLGESCKVDSEGGLDGEVGCGCVGTGMGSTGTDSTGSVVADVTDCGGCVVETPGEAESLVGVGVGAVGTIMISGRGEAGVYFFSAGAGSTAFGMDMDGFAVGAFWYLGVSRNMGCVLAGSGAGVVMESLVGFSGECSGSYGGGKKEPAGCVDSVGVRSGWLATEEGTGLSTAASVVADGRFGISAFSRGESKGAL